MPGTLRQLAFDDVDQFREQLWGWDVDPTQLTAGRLKVLWDTITYDEMTISRLRVNQAIADRSALEPDRFVFVVCLAPKVCCGIDVQPGTLVVFGPGREYRNILHVGWDSFEIAVTRKLLREQRLPFADATLSELAPERCIITLEGELLADFRALAENLTAPFNGSMDLSSNEVWLHCMRERTLHLLESALEPLRYRDARPCDAMRVRGYELTRNALDLIYGEAHELLTVRDLGQFLNCTDRALEYSFRAVLGIPPSQFLLARRLHTARRALKTGQYNGTSVTRAATDSDFYHLGRFAHKYRHFFGEPPSATLRRGYTAPRRNGFPSFAAVYD